MPPNSGLCNNLHINCLLCGFGSASFLQPFSFVDLVFGRYAIPMKHLTSLIATAFVTLLVTGCASTPDPAKVCTSEWIGERSDKAISRIESKASSSLKSLQKAGESWAKGKTPNLIQQALLLRSLKGLEKELKTGRGIKDLKTLSATCNDPKIISDAMGGFLRKQGLPDNIINFIESMGLYQEIIKPDPAVLDRA